jgi:pimeloyl-ACP methyl ester carboxylesterase
MTDFSAAYDELLARWGVAVEHVELDGDFGTTHVNACGPIGRPPVVLLAGHGATSPVWFGVAPSLAASPRVYAIDLIGDAGRSVVRGTPPRTQADLMSWLVGVLDGLGVKDIALCGHSYGGWIALTFALAHPDRVSRLALVDPTKCFTGLRVAYVLRSLPMLLRPSVRRFEAFLRWETDGQPLDPGWVELAGLASVQPRAKPVQPHRPTSALLDKLQPNLLVVVAGRSKSHDPDKLAALAEAHGAEVLRIETATHHSLPAAHTREIVDALQKHLST